MNKTGLNMAAFKRLGSHRKSLVRSGGLLLMALAVMLLFPAAAGAHVTVQPAETVQGRYEVFTVRVPTEKDSATVKVEVRFPEGVDISRFEPKPDWTYQVSKDETGRLTGVVWTAAGAGFGPTEFGEFRMQGRVATSAKELVWKAYQTYADGSVVEWVGAADSDRPASVTTVKAAPAGGADHGHGAAAGGASSGETGGQAQTALYLSIAGLVLGASSLAVSLLRTRK